MLGGVLFDTPVKGDDRVRNLLIERGYSRSKIDSVILQAKQIKLSLIQAGIRKKNITSVIMEQLQKNLEKWN